MAAGIGRPSIFTEELGNTICERMSQGESLRTICADAGMPDRLTVNRWVIADPAFATKYAHARALQADEMFDRMQDVAENHEDVARAKLIVATMQWRAEKLAPKVYGPRLELEHSGAIATEDKQAREQLAAVLAKLDGQ